MVTLYLKLLALNSLITWLTLGLVSCHRHVSFAKIFWGKKTPTKAKKKLYLATEFSALVYSLAGLLQRKQLLKPSKIVLSRRALQQSSNNKDSAMPRQL